MKAKKFFVCASTLLTVLINVPQVSADEVVTFGEEFEGEDDSEVVPFQDENSNEDFGPFLIFNDPENFRPQNPPVENSQENLIPEERPKITNNDDEVIIFDNDLLNSDDERILPPSRLKGQPIEKEKNKKLKKQKPRFVKVTMDKDFIYYLDKKSISWQRVPYSASEYMLDVWVRIIEKNPDTSEIPEDLIEYVNSENSDEVEVALERGIEFAPIDVEVLKHKKYFLQHYYLRPKTKQIQFISELEVVGNPQNTVSQRAYEYKNWEYLIPGSVEFTIYHMTMKEAGKSGSADSGHMSVADMLDEYLRISIR